MLLCVLGSAGAQRPAVCGPGARMELKCIDACIICDIDGFRGSNNNGGAVNEGDKPPSFCTSVNHNIQWIGFLAGSAQLTLELDVTNCQAGSRPDGGLEAGIFEVRDCDLANSVAVSNCDSDIGNNTTQVFTMETLVPGDFYYLVIDGNNGDICDYRVRVTRGTTRVPDVRTSGNLRGPRRVCRGEAFTYAVDRVPGAPYYDWTLDGQPLGRPSDLSQAVTFPADGTYELCVTASNLCNVGPPECLTIRVGDIAPERVRLTSCDNAPVTVGGNTYTASGDYPVTYQTALGCDSTVVYEVRITDRIAVARDTTICAGESIRFGGRDLTAPDVYLATFPTASGCDSTVTLTLRVESCGYGVSARPTDVSCAAGDDGSIVVSVTGPGAPYTLRYRRVGAPGSTTLPLPGDGTPVVLGGLTAGSYELVWRDVYAAEETRIVTVGEPPALQLTLSPQLYAHGFAVSCPGVADGRIRVVAIGGTPPYRYRWADGATGADRVGLAAGTYSLDLVDARGCRQNASVTLAAPAPIPVQTLALETCANEPVELGGRRYDRSGEYTVVYPAANGCDSTVIYALTVLPVSASASDSLICEGWTVDFYGRALTLPGTYRHTLANVHGCDSVVSLRLTTRSCAYVVRTRVEDVACAGGRTGAIWVSVDGSEPSYELTWRGRAGTLGARLRVPGDSTPVKLDALPADEYVLEVVDVFGVRAERRARVEAPAPLLASVASERRGAFDISCAGRADGRLLASARGGTPPYRYEWSNGSRTAQVQGLGPGTLDLRVIDGNGCVTPSSYTLREPAPVVFEASPIDEGCDIAVTPGGVAIGGVSGGQAPYRVRFDDGRLANLAPAYGLPAGRHRITIEDAQGCAAAREVVVGAPERPDVGVTPIRLLERGDSLRLRPEYRGGIVSYAWAGPTALSCTDCPYPTVAPGATAVYTVVVANAAGCTAVAELRVDVGVNTTLYVPTAISPDGDGINDGFTVFAAEPAAVIEEMQVFTRWGEQVFAQADLPVNEPALGWDGTFRGERVNPGVFVFWARVRLPDGGGTEMLTGDVAVIR